MKTTKIIMLAMLLSIGLVTMAQVAINNDGSAPDGSAILDLQSTSQGLLLPRLTNEARDAISGAPAGLFIFNTDMGTIQFYTGGEWQNLTPASCAPNQPDNITGNEYPDCSEQGLIYSIQPVSGASNYEWYVPNNASIVSGDGTTSITVNMGSESGTVQVSASSGCGTSNAQELPITIGTPAQPVSITGNAYPDCGATGITYSIDAVNGATSYNWTMPNDNITIQSGQGTTTIVVDIEAGATSGDMWVNSQNNCGNSDYISYVITIDAPAQPGSIAGTSLPASNSTNTYSVDEVPGATSYEWTVPADASINGDETTSTISVTFGTTDGDITVLAKNNCGSSSATTLAITIFDFACGEQYPDSRNGQNYNTVQIGTQCWFAENLNIGTRIDGANEQTDNSTIEKYCCDDDDANCTTYGGLYQWDEMMQYVTTEGVQGICPNGWHLPTDNEWTTLTDYLGGTSVAGGKMKSISGWFDNGNGTNDSGFTALPGGRRNSYGYFDNCPHYALFWSSSEDSGASAWTRTMEYSNDLVNRYDFYNTSGFSVRCLKN